MGEIPIEVPIGIRAIPIHRGIIINFHQAGSSHLGVSILDVNAGRLPLKNEHERFFRKENPAKLRLKWPGYLEREISLPAGSFTRAEIARSHITPLLQGLRRQPTSDPKWSLERIGIDKIILVCLVEVAKDVYQPDFNVACKKL